MASPGLGGIPGPAVLMVGLGAGDNVADAGLFMPAATEQAAVNGARVVVWHETSVPVLADDEADFVRSLRHCAGSVGVHLCAALAVIHLERPRQRVSTTRRS